MRWSSHIANGWVPAAPIASPLAAAVWITWRRSARSCSPASAVFAHGSVEISSTDSISSGLISPAGAGSSIDSIALTSSSDARVEDHQLLLDPDRVRRALELVLHGGASLTRAGTRRLGATTSETATEGQMALGYDGKLYILAFDHRGSFQKKMFGIEGDPTPEETETISAAKRLIFEGMLEAVQPRRRGRRDRGAGRRAVRLGRPGAGPRGRAEAGDARREVRSGRVRFRVRRRFRRAHRAASTPTSPRCSSGTTPRATPDMNERQLGPAQAAGGLAA